MNNRTPPSAALKESYMGWYGERIFSVLREWMPAGKALRFFIDCEHYGRYGLGLAAERPDCLVVIAQILPGTGPEICRTAAQIASMRGLVNVQFLVASARRLPFRNGSFDAVAAFQAEELEEPESFFNEMARVVMPGGTVVAAMPNRRCTPHRFARWLGGSNRDKPSRLWTAEEIKEQFARCGLGNIRVAGRCFMQSLMRLGSTGPLPWLFRALHIWTLGRWIETHLVSRLDRWTGNRFSNRYGFEIIAAGDRPHKIPITSPKID
ncbi:MAG: class I SAM-dependent methyltransferase [Deltaproteobacteria bacterium]|nr:class I SAM-dependent methyltransferase [Deltaproteobacteria bacterium]MBW2308132.1 class I SAM-dependent methyltransferase [Deltaproteobacteria bacterium]